MRLRCLVDLAAGVPLLALHAATSTPVTAPAPRSQRQLAPDLRISILRRCRMPYQSVS